MPTCAQPTPRGSTREKRRAADRRVECSHRCDPSRGVLASKHLVTDSKEIKQRTSRLVPLLVLATLAVVALHLGTGASAQSSGPRSLRLTELEQGSTFTHIRNTKSAPEQSNLQGDLIVATYRLADAAGQVVGTLHASCTTTVGNRSFLKSIMTCNAVFALRDGTLTGQATMSPGTSSASGAITGGTGAYANARGTFVSKQRAKGSVDTITLED